MHWMDGYDRQGSYSPGVFAPNPSGPVFGGGDRQNSPFSHPGFHQQQQLQSQRSEAASKQDPTRLISVESTHEWQVHDIAYDGQERYLQPLVFSDHVAKLAHKVNWRELIGDTTTRDDPTEEKPETSDDKDKPSTSKAPHAVGPWDNVAKKLHQGLTEMNVLLDVVRVGQAQQYLKFDHTFEYQHERLEQQKAPQLHSQSVQELSEIEWKAQTLAGKRMALHKASGVLQEFIERMKFTAGSAQTEQADSARYLEELREMRERWRLKKVGNLILGDLGYRSYGTKFRPNATFEVKRRAEVSGGGSCMEVVIPKDLEQNLSLIITIQKDGSDSDGVCECGGGVGVGERGQREWEYKWQETLHNAQQTLLIRDIFMQLAREAVQLENQVAIVKERVLTVSLGTGYLLYVRMIPLDSTTDQSSLDAEKNMGGGAIRAETIERNVRKMFCEDLAREQSAILRPVSMTLIPEATQTMLHGPLAKTGPSPAPTEEGGRKKMFLERIIDEAMHLLIVRRVQTVLREFAKECQEPQLTWHWSQMGSTWTVIRAQIMTAHYEACGRGHFVLEIGTSGIDLITRDGERTEMSLNSDELFRMLWIQCRQQQLAAMNVLLRWCGWHLTQSNPYATDSLGNIAPTLLACNSPGNKSICIRLPVQRDPEILMQKRHVKNFGSDVVKSDQWKRLRGEFEHLDYKNFEGFCFFHKVELLLSALA